MRSREPGRQGRVIWMLEADAFPESHARMQEAVRAAGDATRSWSDEWWDSGTWPPLQGEAVVFHGSLGNAARIRVELPWRPGAFCDEAAFRCSAWYPRAAPWLLNREWRLLPASTLVADPEGALRELGSPERVFVRPDSPLKPFSGRVLAREVITLRALDHGFYYEDAELPVLVAAARAVGREWRYVIVDRAVVAGCAYAAEGRKAAADDPTGESWRYAAFIAASLDPPEDVYVLDVAEHGAELRLVELNPFSGADLYECDRAAVVAAVSRHVLARLDAVAS